MSACPRWGGSAFFNRARARPRRRLLPHEQNDHDHENGLSVSTRFDPQRFNNQRSSTRTRTSTITIGEEAMPL